MKYEKPEIEMMKIKYEDVITESPEPGSGNLEVDPEVDDVLPGDGW